MTNIYKQYYDKGREWRLEYASLEGIVGLIQIAGSNEYRSKRYWEIRKNVDRLTDEMVALGKKMAIEEGLIDE